MRWSLGGPGREALDFDACPDHQFGYAQRDPGRRPLAGWKEFGVHLVHRREVGHVRDVDTDFDDVFEVGTRLAQNRADILERLARFRADPAGDTE